MRLLQSNLSVWLGSNVGDEVPTGESPEEKDEKLVLFETDIKF